MSNLFHGDWVTTLFFQDTYSGHVGAGTSHGNSVTKNTKNNYNNIIFLKIKIMSLQKKSSVESGQVLIFGTVA